MSLSDMEKKISDIGQIFLCVQHTQKLAPDFFGKFLLVKSLGAEPPANFDHGGESSRGESNEVKVYFFQFLSIHTGCSNIRNVW